MSYCEDSIRNYTLAGSLSRDKYLDRRERSSRTSLNMSIYTRHNTSMLEEESVKKLFDPTGRERRRQCSYVGGGGGAGGDVGGLMMNRQRTYLPRTFTQNEVLAGRE